MKFRFVVKNGKKLYLTKFHLVKSKPVFLIFLHDDSNSCGKSEKNSVL